MDTCHQLHCDLQAKFICSCNETIKYCSKHLIEHNKLCKKTFHQINLLNDKNNLFLKFEGIRNEIVEQTSKKMKRIAIGVQQYLKILSQTQRKIHLKNTSNQINHEIQNEVEFLIETSNYVIKSKNFHNIMGYISDKRLNTLNDFIMIQNYIVKQESKKLNKSSLSTNLIEKQKYQDLLEENKELKMKITNLETLLNNSKILDEEKSNSLKLMKDEKNKLIIDLADIKRKYDKQLNEKNVLNKIISDMGNNNEALKKEKLKKEKELSDLVEQNNNYIKTIQNQHNSVATALVTEINNAYILFNDIKSKFQRRLFDLIINQDIDSRICGGLLQELGFQDMTKKNIEKILISMDSLYMFICKRYEDRIINKR